MAPQAHMPLVVFVFSLAVVVTQAQSSISFDMSLEDMVKVVQKSTANKTMNGGISGE